MASLLNLTDRQRTELNHAILDYLVSQGDKYVETVEYFRKEGNLGVEVELGKGLLEKKWTSVIRLQKKVMELEAKLEQLQKPGMGVQSIPSTDSLDSASNNNPSNLLGGPKLLPRPPARACLNGHRAAVSVVVIHPVFSLIASGSEDSTIRLWDCETNQYERTLKGHTGPITGLAFDTKGLLLASSSTDMSAKLWDMNSFNCIRTLKGHDHTISAVQFYANNDQLITCSRDATIKFWEVNTGYCSKTFNGHSDWIKTFSISLDGNYLASGGNDQLIYIWQISTGNILQVGIWTIALIFLQPVLDTSRP